MSPRTRGSVKTWKARIDTYSISPSCQCGDEQRVRHAAGILRQAECNLPAKLSPVSKQVRSSLQVGESCASSASSESNFVPVAREGIRGQTCRTSCRRSNPRRRTRRSPNGQATPLTRRQRPVRLCLEIPGALFPSSEFTMDSSSYKSQASGTCKVKADIGFRPETAR